MGTDELRKRENWQSESGDRALKAEDIFYNVFKEAFKSSDFEVVVKPTDLNNIYKKIKLDETVLQTIFQPAQDYGKHGVAPDFAIRNNATGKTLYIEVKRQDGWVEGKKPSAGRGNAHERLCKYFTPGLLNKMRTTSNITSSDLPFWVIFVGDITRDPKRVREIHCWFDNYCDNFFLWQDTNDGTAIINHFNEKIKTLLL